MADYTSKFTGSEIDGILDEAIELPTFDQSNDVGKILVIGEQGLEWDSVPSSNDETLSLPSYAGCNGGDILMLQTGGTSDPGWYSLSEVLSQSNNATDGDVLKYSSNTGVYWDAEFSIDTSNAHDGDILKYSSDSGLQWGDNIDISSANDGDVLKYSSNTGIYWDSTLDISSANDGDVLKYNSDAGIYWDSILDTSNANDGDILKYSSDAGVYWGAAEQSIDMTNANDGNILKYSSDTGMYWDTPNYLVTDDCGPQPGDFLMYTTDCGIQWEPVFPTHDGNDAGKVLTVASNGAVVWMDPNDAINLYNQINNN